MQFQVMRRSAMPHFGVGALAAIMFLAALLPGLAAAADWEPLAMGMARYLLEKADVAVVPGTFFGSPGHIRISFATSFEQLSQGLQRIKDVL